MVPFHIERILFHFQNSQDQVVIGIGDQKYTYGELNNRVKSIALGLRNIEEKRIGLFLESSLEAYASILACWLMGKSYVILSPKYPFERIKKIIHQGDIRTIIGLRSALPDEFDKLDLSFLDLEKWNAFEKDFNFSTSMELDEAYVLFTSGTTGEPKGVPISHVNLANFVAAFLDLGYDLNHEDRFLQMFELTFDLSIMSYLIPMVLGASFYLINQQKIKPIAIYEVLEIQEITFALMVPSVVKTMEPYLKDEILEKVKYTQFCGEALMTSQVKSWQKICPNSDIDNVYGPTEATIYCTRYRVPRGLPIKNWNGLVCIGQPMFGTDLCIMNEELLIGGAQVTHGYLKIPSENQPFEVIQETSYYRTGDLATKVDSDFYCLGRLDRQVKIQGFRVELSEIEHAFQKVFPQHESVVLYIRQDVQEKLILCILDPENKRIEIEIINHLKAVLPSYMIPQQILKFENWPLNSNGKIDRKQLEYEFLHS